MGNARAGDLIAHLRMPLHRNAYALILSNVVTSGLGFLYWLIAARLYDARSVGVDSTLISTMVLLAGVSQLNLRSALNRFVPLAGAATARLIGFAYLATLPGAVVVPVVVLTIARVSAPDSTLGRVGGDPVLVAIMIVAVASWSIFNMQDGVLTGLRQTLLVPVENALYAVAKIVLLVAFVTVLHDYGIFTSWVLPTLVAVVVVTSLLFRRLIPLHVARSADRAKPLAAKLVVRFAAGDYLGALFVLGYMSLLPVIVLNAAGPAAGAEFYIAWTIATSLNLVPLSMTISHTVETVYGDHDVVVQTRGVLIHMARLLVPMVAAVVVVAPWVLTIFGRNYAQGATELLRLLALGVIPYAINVLYFSMARVQARIRGIVVVQGVLAVLTLSTSLVALDRFGITGIGIGWLASQGVVALFLLAGPLRPVIVSGRHRPG